jgi:tRNA A-37 threonylcarbamoyl transferase component Bud32
MGNYAEFDLSGHRWKVKPELAQVLTERVIPLALSGKDSPDVHVVSRKHVRDSFVVSTEDSSGRFFVKVYRNHKFRDRIKTMVRPSRARAEWLIGAGMLDSGLPVAEPLAYGEFRSGLVVVGCVLIARALENCQRLSSYLYRNYHHDDPHPSTDQPDEFLESLGTLIRRMHDAGFRHPDLHTGNILVKDDGSSPSLWIIDLHSAAGPSPLSRRARMANLAKMIFSLRGFLNESQLREILAAYDPEAGSQEQGNMLIKLLDAADSLQKKRVKSRSKRCLKTSGKFVVEKVGSKKLYRRREFDADTVLGFVNCHREIHAAKGAQLIKATSKSVLTCFPLPDRKEENIYVKEFNNRGLIRLLETILYTHRGRRSWKAGHLLLWTGIPTADLIALVEQREFGVAADSYLVMKEIPNATRLNAFLLQHYFRISGGLTGEVVLEKRKLIREGARALRDFHSKKIYHKDLSTKNLLVGRDDDEELRFFCVDTDSIQFPPRLSLRRRIKNLAQLNGLPACVTTADRIRFYKEYFGLHSLTPVHKLLIRLIRRLSRQRMEHSKRIDARVRKNFPLDEQAYEDIASI